MASHGRVIAVTMNTRAADAAFGVAGQSRSRVKSPSKIVRIVERALLSLGAALLAVFLLAHLHRLIMFQAAMRRFEDNKLEAIRAPETVETIKAADAGEGANAREEPSGNGGVEYALWSVQRIGAYERGLTRPVDPPLAILRIPKVRLEVPVLNGVDDLTLNRGVGRIPGTALPGQEGNIGIAGHRDGFFRGLKDILAGDIIELHTTIGTDVYVVDEIRITNPDDLSVLRRRPKPSLTLVTCYPFYFIGSAPKRYVVEASLKR
jgi:sortase A